MDNKPNFWGPIAGIRRTEGSVNSTVTTELVYERKGCDTFHPLKEATTEFAVEVSFSDGGGNRWINTMSAKQLDDVIAQLQAIKARMAGTMASSDVKAIFAENNRAFEKMCITRAAADKRAELHALNADLNTMLHGEMPNGKKASTKKRLEAIDWTVKEIDEVKAELDKFEAALAKYE